MSECFHCFIPALFKRKTGTWIFICWKCKARFEL